MPVSSRASRSATYSPVASPGSAWPPGWSQRCSLRWCSSSTRAPDADIVRALPGEVALDDGAVERPRVPRHEVEDLPEVGRLFRIGRLMPREVLGQSHARLF